MLQTGGTQSDIFTCQNGFAVPARDQCDFENDCIDGSDELGCGMSDMCGLCSNGEVGHYVTSGFLFLEVAL